MKNPSISIGISVHNEEANIQSLLESILKQEENDFVLKEIIVVADGCTDKTVEKVKEVKDIRIRLLNDGKRKGKSARLNDIFKTFSGDILFLLDGDIVINDKNLFEKIITQTNFEESGVVSPNFRLITPKNFLEKSLLLSMDVQDDLRRKWNNGKNYLVFKGAFMCVYGKLAKTIHIPEKLVNNDGYIYFWALQKGYQPKYLPDVYIYYKLPSTWKDHLAQSSRYQGSRAELSQYISIDPKEYTIPKFLYYTISLKHLLKKPIYFTGYIGVRVATRLVKNKKMNSQWTTASSTKQI